MGFFKSSARIVGVLTFVWAMLAAYGLESLLAMRERFQRRFKWFLVSIIGSLSIFLTLMGILIHHYEIRCLAIIERFVSAYIHSDLLHPARYAWRHLPGAPREFAVEILTHLQEFLSFSNPRFYGPLLWLAAGLVLIGLSVYVKRFRSVGVVVACAFIFANLCHFGMFYNRAFLYEDIIEPPETVKWLKQNAAGDYRVLTRNQLANLDIAFLKELCTPDVNLLWEIPLFKVYSPLALDRYMDVKHLLDTEILRNGVQIPWYVAHNNLLNLFNIRYVIIENSVVLDGFIRRYTNPMVSLWENPDALPVYFLVNGVATVTDRAKTTRILHDSSVNFRKVALIEDTLDAELPETPARGTVRLWEKKARKLELEVKSETPSLLVMMRTYYPGWRAFVDGEERRLHRTNYIGCGVRVPAGISHVMLLYEPKTYKLGKAFSLYAIILCLAGILGCGVLELVQHRMQPDCYL